MIQINKYSMQKIKKQNVKNLTSDLKFPKAVVINPTVMPSGISRGYLNKPERKGNYSGIGYNSLDGPLTEAERWNMPFIDPEFYDSRTED